MDVGCLDLGCISVSDKRSNDALLDSQSKEADSSDSASSASKPGKSKSLKENSQSMLSALNKFTLQIKKPSHRKNSPLNWFPRKKVDSYLKRKIKMLQEVDGMNLTLDETLGDSNPHYSRVLREKMAAREAAHKAMEARKAALVEASWCRILRAARIQSKEAEALLLKAEKAAAEAFEAATAVGVIMYDIPNCSQKPGHIETSSINGGSSTTHTVTASFETAFEVDKEVAAAVKNAFIKLASSPSFIKNEFKDLLWKIRRNPEEGDGKHELSEFSSECESEAGSELETLSQKDGASHQDLDRIMPVVDVRQRKSKRRKSFERLNMEKLVNMMLERLQCLQEDELSSLATIVATCGLNAALAEVGNSKLHNPGSTADCPSASTLNVPCQMPSLGGGANGNSNFECFNDEWMRRKQAEPEFPSLDKFLVKHVSKLEKEVQEARKTVSREGAGNNSNRVDDRIGHSDSSMGISEAIPDLGSVLVKHSSKFEKEIEEAKKNAIQNFGTENKNRNRDLTSSEAIPDLGSVLVKHSSRLEKEIEETKRHCQKTHEINSQKKGRMVNGAVSLQEVPSLDKCLVKHVSRLEKEVQEAKNRRNHHLSGGCGATSLTKKVDSSTSITQEQKNANFCSDGGAGKENIGSNERVDRSSVAKQEECKLNLKAEREESLDKMLVKPVHRLEREKMQVLSSGSNSENHRLKQRGNHLTDYESLDKVLVKHIPRLEKEKMRFNENQHMVKVKNRIQSQISEEGTLDQILVKHEPKLDREKMAAAEQPEEQITRKSVTRKEARERELQEIWGGLSLGNSIRPHLSKLERDKAAWINAEEEERRQALRKVV